MPGAYSTLGEWMRSGSFVLSASLAAAVVLLAASARMPAQDPAPPAEIASVAELPEAPPPQIAPADIGSPIDPTQIEQAPQQPAVPPTPQSSSSAQAPPAGSSTSAPAPQTEAEKQAETRRKAQEQLQEQEKQRVMGVMATFNTTRNKDAAPLSPKQKFQLFFRSSIDPWPFLLAGVVAGIGQADDSTPEWGQGMQGYSKRFGAGYTDAFIGNFFGNAVLPVLLREDPRYFQKGTGSVAKRALWAAASTFWCRRDNGKWGPNYANVGGNIIGSAISTLYKPNSENGIGDILTDGLTVSAEGILGAEVIEFWPDLVRHHRQKQAEKLARKAAQSTAAPATQPATPASTPSKPRN